MAILCKWRLNQQWYKRRRLQLPIKQEQNNGLSTVTADPAYVGGWGGYLLPVTPAELVVDQMDIMRNGAALQSAAANASSLRQALNLHLVFFQNSRCFHNGTHGSTGSPD